MLSQLKIYVKFSIVFFEVFLKYFIIIVPILLSLIFLILIERKVIASLQKRKGPNVVGIFGLSQSLADALKIINEGNYYSLSF